MKILIDHQIFQNQKFGGISRYFYELIKTLNTNNNVKLSLLFSENEYIKKRDFSKHFSNPLKSDLTLKLYYILNELNTRKNLKFGNYDIFHPTYFNSYYVNNIKIPYVITCYDLIHEKFSEKYPVFSNPKTLENRRKTMINAQKVIAISESTKKDIIDYYHIAPEKIDVVYLATSLKKSNLVVPPAINCDYILFVGNRDYYKNFILFVKSIKDILIKNKDLFLVCGGGGAFKKEELEYLSELGIKDKLIYTSFDDEKLINLYSNAKMFVFPSLYEGFGIPILESMACGCPTLLSNTSSLPEVGGDAAIYFDPYSESSIYEAVNSVLTSKELSNSLIKKGIVQSEKFSWKKTAEETLEVYKTVVK